MTKGTHLLRSALLALLALAVISGGSLAAGDLFDDDYSDCPHRTRLRDGQISDLSVNRDSEEEDEVNVAWGATDPTTWGLGANAYSTSLVVILDDGTDVQTETLSLGSRQTTFEGVGTGVEVTVQMAIVVDTADGDYLISDILETSINQSLTEPSFSRAWNQITADTDGDADTDGFQYQSEAVAGGLMYYIGYNQNFGNYKAGSGLTTSPSTARLRIGLAHSSNEDNDARDDVDFEAYIIRITDEDGDVVDEGDDVATVGSSYGTTGVGAAEALNKLFIADLETSPTFTDDDGTVLNTDYALTNVRINDGGTISPALHLVADPGVLDRNDTRTVIPDALSIIRVGSSTTVGAVFADPPDEHRDLPMDTLTSDTTYTITAWAINEDDEVISPVATLEVRPSDAANTATAVTDYLNAAQTVEDLVVTRFTVLK